MYYQLPSFTVAIETQGDTGTPSILSIKPYRNLIQYETEFAVRVRVCDEGSMAVATNATIAPTSAYGTTITTNDATKDLDIRTQPGVQATETLTISGVAIDGETVTIGSRIYEFDTDGAVTAGNVAIDISGDATASQGTLTIDTQVTATNTMTIGGRSWVFVPDGDEGSDGEISVGSDLATCKTNIVAAINGTDGANTASTLVTISDFTVNDAVLTAIVPGTDGDTIATTENFGAGGNIFDAATLGTTTAGVDCTAADAVTALAAAVTGDTSAVVTAVDGAGDTVDITAVTAGVAANAFPTTETMANGAFGDTVMSGGLDELLGEIRVSLTDASAESVVLRFGAPAVAGILAEYVDVNQAVTHAAP